jgi:hypothetical protein
MGRYCRGFNFELCQARTGKTEATLIFAPGVNGWGLAVVLAVSAHSQISQAILIIVRSALKLNHAFFGFFGIARTLARSQANRSHHMGADTSHAFANTTFCFCVTVIGAGAQRLVIIGNFGTFIGGQIVKF